MDRPVPLVSVVFGWLVAVCVVAAEEAAAPKRARQVSPHMAEVLTDVALRAPQATDPSGTATDAAGRPRVTDVERDVPANGIVRLPEYLVREPKLPSREEVTSRHSLEQMAMQKYFGDETSLYRVMNMLSPVYLWRKVPVLGKYPFMIGQFNGPGSGPARGNYTTEDEAMSRSENDKRRERWTDLMGLLTPAERARVSSPEAPIPSPSPPAK